MDDYDTDTDNMHFYLGSSNTSLRALIGYTCDALILKG